MGHWRAPHTITGDDMTGSEVATTGRRAATLSVIGAIVLIPLVTPDPAAAAPAQSCTIIGYTAGNADEAGRLRKTLAGQSSNELSGVQLGRSGTWKVPDGSVPIVVIESTQPLTAGSATVSVFGLSFDVASGSGGSCPASAAPNSPTSASASPASSVAIPRTSSPPQPRSSPTAGRST